MMLTPKAWALFICTLGIASTSLTIDKCLTLLYCGKFVSNIVTFNHNYMKKSFSLLALFFISCLFSQTSYYYHNGKKQELQIDRQKINIFTASSFQQQ